MQAQVQRRAKTKGALETGVRARAKRGSIERALLGTLAVAGLLTVAAAAPKVLSLIKEEHLELVLPKDPRQRLHETASRLKRKGLVSFEMRGGRKQMRLTEKGERELARLALGSYQIPKPRRWDRRWRIVIFDISEKRRKDRLRVRLLLQNLGFVRLQDSVWVYPYNCEEVIALLKNGYGLGTALLYIIADAVEFDSGLRQLFSLPLD